MIHNILKFLLPLNQPITYLDRSNVWFNISIKHTASPLIYRSSRPGPQPSLTWQKVYKCSPSAFPRPSIPMLYMDAFGSFIMVAVNVDRGRKHSTFFYKTSPRTETTRTTMCYSHKKVHRKTCYWEWSYISGSVSTHPSSKYFLSGYICMILP